MKPLLYLMLILAEIGVTSNAFAASLSINNLTDKSLSVQYILNKHDTDIPLQTHIDPHSKVIGMLDGWKEYLSVQIQEVSVGGKIIQCPGIELFKKYPGVELTIFSNGDCEATSVTNIN